MSKGGGKHRNRLAVVVEPKPEYVGKHRRRGLRKLFAKRDVADTGYVGMRRMVSFAVAA